MKRRERQHDEPEQRQHSGAPAPADPNLREQAERLLAAGADAIAQALSTDSTAFLQANRQESGQ